MMQQTGQAAVSQSTLSDLMDLQRRRLILESGRLLSDVLSTLNALVLAERATYGLVDTEQSVNGSATVTLLNQITPPNQVCIYQPLVVVPNVSNVFTMSVTIDNQNFFQDNSVIEFPVVPTGQWLPFYQSFVVSVTNGGGSAAIIHLLGGLYTIKQDDWRAIHDRLRLAYRIAIYPDQNIPGPGEPVW